VLRGALTVLGVLLGGSVASAQLEPPRVLEGPPGSAERAAEVVVEVRLDAGGAVVEASAVVAGPLAERAAELVRGRWRFEPARRDGEGVPARVRVVVPFAASADALPDDAPHDADDALPHADDALPHVDDAPTAEVSTADADPAEPEYGATATTRATRGDAVERRISGDELGRAAGTRDDPIRSVELLPGMGRPALISGALLVRGSAPRDTAVFVDGVQIPQLYHFGGLRSVVPGAFLDSVAILPGGFSVRYGRRVGGVAEIRTRALRDGIEGGGRFDVLDAAARVEGGGPRVRTAFGVRRSLVDLALASFVPVDVAGDIAAPAYWDYQAFADVRASPRDDVSVRVFGGHDRLVLDLGDSTGSDPAFRDRLGGTQQFHQGALRWRHRAGPGRERLLQLAIGSDRYDAGVGPANLDLRNVQIQGRLEWRARLGEAVSLHGGFDLQHTRFRVDFLGPPPRQTEGAGPQPPLAAERLVALERRGGILRPAAFLETRWRLARVEAVLGLRLDYFSEIDAFTFDPRLVVRTDLTRWLSAQVHAGLFSQPPELAESEPTLGNPALSPLRALHLGAGLRASFEGIRGSVEVFEKRLWDLPTAGQTLPFETRGTGRIRGLEVFARWERAPMVVQLAYTYSRSLRRDAPSDPERPFDYDQPHLASAALLATLPDDWSAGATFRYASGRPRTPVRTAVYDARLDVYVPIPGEPQSERDPAFHRLDLRVEKRFRRPRGVLRLYLDVQNVYNRGNAEGFRYSYDYRERAVVRGLPILPSLGVGGSF